MLTLSALSAFVLIGLSLSMSYGFTVLTPKNSAADAFNIQSSRAMSATPAARACGPNEAIGAGGITDIVVGRSRRVDPPLTEFQKFVKRPRSRATNVVIDLRPPADFCREHLVGATSIPANELEPRLLELPPPFAQPMSIVGNEEDFLVARDFLTGKGWKIDQEITPDKNVWGSIAWLTESGPRSVQAWRANDFLEFCMERFLLPSSAHDESDTSGEVLDLGCGSGRDAVYMAQKLQKRSRVIGVDNHSFALERGAKLSELWVDGGRKGDTTKNVILRGIADLESLKDSAGPTENGGIKKHDEARSVCEWLLTDLRKPGSLDGLQASVIHGHRFKCEQLLPVLRDEVLLPGGFFIWSTFLDTGTTNLVPPWRPSRMMRVGELADIFSGEDFEILIDEEGKLPTRGSSVPAKFFACRKRPGARSLL